MWKCVLAGMVLISVYVILAAGFAVHRDEAESGKAGGLTP